MTDPDPNVSRQLQRDARARAWLAWLWAVLGVAVGVVVLSYAGDGPVGQTLRVAGVLMLVGVVVAVVTAGLNHGLMRQPSRAGVGGPASIATLTLAVALTVGIVAALLVGRPLSWADLPILLLVLAGYLALGLVAGATWWATRPVIATRQPLRSTRA